MTIASFTDELIFHDRQILTKKILETSFSKEIQICIKEDHTMKEHQAPYPIIVHVLEGRIQFGINGEVHAMNKGAILTLNADVPHHIKAEKDSIIRLTLSKFDDPNRVQSVANNS